MIVAVGPDLFARRIDTVHAELARREAGALLLGPSADLRWLAGYDALPLERLTLFVVPPEGEATLIVPELERPRAEASPAPGVARIVAWDETADPFALLRSMLPPGRKQVFVSDTLWATFLLRLQVALPGASFDVASRVLRKHRARKDVEEVAALRRAAAVVDGISVALRGEKVAGRTEREVARWLGEQMIVAGCERVLFTIVASGPNAASPHHEPSERVIEPGDVLVCDFGGMLGGYCSDITRTYVVGEPNREFARVWDAVAAAQQAAFEAVRPGVAAQDVDRAARGVIARAGHAEHFIHRTGHGIGLEEHEQPWIVEGNTEPLEPGNAFSIEPGIYVPGRFGGRLEDIVVVTEDGAERLNDAPHELAVLS